MEQNGAERSDTAAAAILLTFPRAGLLLKCVSLSPDHGDRGGSAGGAGGGASAKGIRHK